MGNFARNFLICPVQKNRKVTKIHDILTNMTGIFWLQVPQFLAINLAFKRNYNNNNNLVNKINFMKLISKRC